MPLQRSKDTAPRRGAPCIAFAPGIDAHIDEFESYVEIAQDSEEFETVTIPRRVSLMSLLALRGAAAAGSTVRRGLVGLQQGLL